MLATPIPWTLATMNYDFGFHKSFTNIPLDHVSTVQTPQNRSNMPELQVNHIDLSVTLSQPKVIHSSSHFGFKNR